MSDNDLRPTRKLCPATTTGDAGDSYSCALTLGHVGDHHDGDGICTWSQDGGLTELGTAVDLLAASNRAIEEEKAKTAAIRRVLVDCHAHDLYVRDGSNAADAYLRAHGRGIPWDESAADHEASVRAAISGALGGELLDELRQARRSLGEGPAAEIADLRRRLVRAERLLAEEKGECAAAGDEALADPALVRTDVVWALTASDALPLNALVRDMARRLYEAQHGPGLEPEWPERAGQIAGVIDEAVRACATVRVLGKSRALASTIEAVVGATGVLGEVVRSLTAVAASPAFAEALAEATCRGDAEPRK